MNLETINTVTDLINANSDDITADSVYDQVLELKMDEAIVLVTRVVETLACFHQEQRNEEDDDRMRSNLWAHDEALLSSALGILKRVQLD